MLEAQRAISNLNICFTKYCYCKFQEDIAQLWVIRVVALSKLNIRTQIHTHNTMRMHTAVEWFNSEFMHARWTYGCRLKSTDSTLILFALYKTQLYDSLWNFIPIVLHERDIIICNEPIAPLTNILQYYILYFIFIPDFTA